MGAEHMGLQFSKFYGFLSTGLVFCSDHLPPIHWENHRFSGSCIYTRKRQSAISSFVFISYKRHSRKCSENLNSTFTSRNDSWYKKNMILLWFMEKLLTKLSEISNWYLIGLNLVFNFLNRTKSFVCTFWDEYPDV